MSNFAVEHIKESLKILGSKFYKERTFGIGSTKTIIFPVQLLYLFIDFKVCPTNSEHLWNWNSTGPRLFSS